MVPLTPDSAYSDDLLVAEPFKNNPGQNLAMLSIVTNTYPVNEVYYNGVNVNVSLVPFYDGDGYKSSEAVL